MKTRIDFWSRTQAARIADWLDGFGDRFHRIAGLVRGWAAR